MSISINPDTTSVSVTAASNTVTVVDAANNVNISVTQPTTQVVRIATPGPQGPVGPAPDTGSLVTTASFNAFTSSYNTGSFLGSFLGNLSGTSSFATTASYFNVSNLATTGSNIFSGNQTINGNLTVIGTSSFAYTTASVVSVGTNIITLNTDNPASRFGGITVIDSGSFGTSSTGSLFWDSLNNRWIYSNPSGSSYDGGMLISGPRNTSGLGNETGMDVNFVAVGQATDHIRPGTIYNSGSITQITGSLSISQGITGSVNYIGNQVVTGSNRGNVTALTISSNTASIDLSVGNFFTLQLVAGTNTFVNPSNVLPGQTSILTVSTTGSATVSFPSFVKQPSGSAYTPTTTTGVDILTLVSVDSTTVYIANIKNMV